MKYRSKLEGKVARLLGAKWKYEARKIPYVMHRNYTADFIDEEDIVLEVKGFFRPGDQAKYIAVRDAVAKEGKQFVFCFSDPNKPVRRGAKLTHGLWCEKHDIPYTSVAKLKEFLDDLEQT